MSPANQVEHHLIYHQPRKPSGHIIYHHTGKSSGTHDLSSSRQIKWDTWFIMSPVNQVGHMIYHQPSKPNGDTRFIIIQANQVGHMIHQKPRHLFCMALGFFSTVYWRFHGNSRFYILLAQVAGLQLPNLRYCTHVTAGDSVRYKLPLPSYTVCTTSVNPTLN